ncbi:hypothetical protein RhiirA1_467193 [Rhizophagus irregularis]|uniref:Uncharacterized protein n=1 Tax=Rhizophagus irregularis TaxID=588596 RepID=A0A2N0RCH8_9GLOM|nr:hypothetical protein RhiirA1_467193 [Rhizophagus irregularis]
MSALMILELCCNIEDKTMLPLLSNFLCIVAPLKILEALKTSLIYCQADFHKNISDLHLLRDYVALTQTKKKNIAEDLYSPQRDELIELILETRIKETEIIYSKPGAYSINLNMSNDDFLEYEDNLFVQKCISHEDLYELVKYGDHPIYQGLRDGQVITLRKIMIIDDDEDEDSDSFDMDHVGISFKDPLKIHPYQIRYSGNFSKLNSKHTFVLGISSEDNIWEPINVEVKSADFVASLLEIPDITGDLLFKYVLDYLKPTLDFGETPLQN